MITDTTRSAARGQLVAHMPEKAPLCALNDDPKNPREISPADLTNLIASIREFGIVENIVARREDGMILGGHQRVGAIRQALTALGYSEAEADSYEVPVVWLDNLTDAKARALNLGLNKIHGTWDFAKLTVVLTEIGAELAPDEIPLTGFDAGEIADIGSLMSGPPTGSGGAGPTTDTRASARRFTIEVASDAEAKECRDALQLFGMEPSGIGAAAAFVAALRVARAHGPKKGPVMPPIKHLDDKKPTTKKRNRK